MGHNEFFFLLLFCAAVVVGWCSPPLLPRPAVQVGLNLKKEMQQAMMIDQTIFGFGRECLFYAFFSMM